MTRSLPSTVLTMEIPFHDVDSMAIVWHGHYVKYFELARCQLLREIDYSYVAMRDSGYAWPVVDLHVKYVQPLRYEQLVAVKATLLEWQHRLKIGYVITDARTGQKLTKGHTVQVAIHMGREELQFESPDILAMKLKPWLSQ